jgi:hypothetical protein
VASGFPILLNCNMKIPHYEFMTVPLSNASRALACLTKLFPKDCT